MKFESLIDLIVSSACWEAIGDGVTFAPDDAALVRDRLNETLTDAARAGWNPPPWWGDAWGDASWQAAE